MLLLVLLRLVRGLVRVVGVGRVHRSSRAPPPAWWWAVTWYGEAQTGKVKDQETHVTLQSLPRQEGQIVGGSASQQADPQS
jgi:hypothetical protein